MRRIICVFPLGICIVCASAALVQDVAADEEGDVAPVNTWYVAGGCAAGTGATLTKPIPGPIELAWKYVPHGRVVGEPLVWEKYVILEAEESREKRHLCFLNLDTGVEIESKTFDTSVTLSPSLWGNSLVVRNKADELKTFRLKANGMTQHRVISSEHRFSAPLLYRSRIVVGEGERIVCRNVSRKDEIWGHDTGMTIVGRPVLRGEWIYAAGFEGSDGGVFILQYTREGGVQVNKYSVGYARNLAATSDRIRLSVYDEEVVLHSSIPISWLKTLVRPPQLDSDTFFHIGLARSPARQEPRNWRFALLWCRDKTAAAEWNGRLLNRSVDPKHGEYWALLRPQEDGMVKMFALANAHVHPELLDFTSPPSFAEGAAYMAGLCADTRVYADEPLSIPIRWVLPFKADHRLIPARNSVLAVDEDGHLRAYRDATFSAEEKTDAALSMDGEYPCLKGRAVTRDGEVIDLRKFTIRGDEKTLVETVGRRERSRPLSDVVLVESGKHGILYMADPSDAVEAVDLLIEEDLAGEYLELAEEARRSNDPALMERLAEEAELRGVSDKELKTVYGKLASLKKRPMKVKQKIGDDIRKAEEALAGFSKTAFWKRAGPIIEKFPRSEYSFTFLRTVLSRDPMHVQACRLLVKMLPAEIRGLSEFNVLEWLDFASVIEKQPVTVVHMPESERAAGSEEERILAAQAGWWRPDLVGVKSDNLFIIAPVLRPGSLAKCLMRGEQVCSALENMGHKVDYSMGRRLVLHLYETQKEYERHTKKGNKEIGSGLEWSAGHYAWDRHVSRIYIPEEKAPFESIMKTYAHELTHHWLADKCRYGGETMMKLIHQKAYWIVEGFASFMEEVSFDPLTGECDMLNPRSMRLDVVANAQRSGAERVWIPWDRLFNASGVDFFGDAYSEEVAYLSLTWQLGTAAGVVQRGMFYNQAAAACIYLYNAEGGRYRERLLKYLWDYYQLKEDRLDVEKAFGLSAEELGQRIKAYARETVKQPG